jgi:predicted O-methyltransferase YrrM
MIDIWVTYKAKAWLEQMLRKDMACFEWGSGYGTLWLAQRVRLIVSVEHSLAWIVKVKKALKQLRLSNVVLVWEEDLGLYPKVITLYADCAFDFVFVDGRMRVDCVRCALPKVKLGGVLMLDNSDRALYGEAVKMLADWRSLDFKGEGRGGSWTTTAWLKATNQP